MVETALAFAGCKVFPACESAVYVAGLCPAGGSGVQIDQPSTQGIVVSARLISPIVVVGDFHGSSVFRAAFLVSPISGRKTAATLAFAYALDHAMGMKNVHDLGLLSSRASSRW